MGSIKPHAAHIAEWGGIEVAAERVLQRPGGDGGRASDVEQGEVLAGMGLDVGHREAHRAGRGLGVFPGCRVVVPGGVGEGGERRRGEGPGCRSQKQWAGGRLRIVQYRAGVLHSGLPVQAGRCRDGQQTREPYRPSVVLGIACGHLRQDRQLDTA